jgi:hypothetical protein
LAGYYRKFIYNFNAVARLLTNLLKKNNIWKMRGQGTSSFDLLKVKLITAPLLQYPNFEEPFIITTDISGYAIGSILNQKKIGL